jgi:hypothetical protein
MEQAQVVDRINVVHYLQAPNLSKSRGKNNNQRQRKCVSYPLTEAKSAAPSKRHFRNGVSSQKLYIVINVRRSNTIDISRG